MEITLRNVTRFSPRDEVLTRFIPREKSRHLLMLYYYKENQSIKPRLFLLLLLSVTNFASDCDWLIDVM